MREKESFRPHTHPVFDGFDLEDPVILWTNQENIRKLTSVNLNKFSYQESKARGSEKEDNTSILYSVDGTNMGLKVFSKRRKVKPFLLRHVIKHKLCR